MDPLAKLFGSPHRVKFLKLFFANKDGVFTTRDIKSRLSINDALAKKELRIASDAGLIKKKKISGRGVQEVGWQLNSSFPYLNQMSALFSWHPSFMDRVSRRFKRVGNIKLLVLSGFFVGASESDVDIVFIGDRLKERDIEKNVRDIEGELGRELRFALSDTETFLYRLETQDRFTRNLLERPHKILVNKLTSPVF